MGQAGMAQPGMGQIFRAHSASRFSFDGTKASASRVVWKAMCIGRSKNENESAAVQERPRVAL
jgi:hypothetical protein